jgi:photosystem II stability/assembly factor-like uncharacterized protein
MDAGTSSGSVATKSVSSTGFMPRLRAGLQNTLRGTLLVIAFGLFIGLTLLAVSQSLRPDPYQEGESLSFNWWFHPYEHNANNRLPVMGADINAIFALPDASQVWAVGNRGLLAHSTNGGVTWTRQTGVMPKDFEPRDLVGVYFDDAENGWMRQSSPDLSPPLTFRTANGGASWLSSIETTLALTVRVPVAISDQKYSLCPTPDSAYWDIAKGTPAAGHLWGSPKSFNYYYHHPSSPPNPGEPEQLYAVFGLSHTLAWVAGTNGAVFKTTNAGESWQPQKTNSDKFITALYFLPDGQRGWAAGHYGTLQYTEDGGETWTAQESHTDTTLSTIYFLPDGLRGWAGGTSGVILHTEDSGKHWAHQTREYSGPLTATAQPRAWRILPPWYYVSLLVPGLLGFLALRPQRTEFIPEETVADIFISDRPLEPGEADPMNFWAVALGLSRFLRNDKTLPPLTIAITGEWGTGKSSLMNLLRADLRTYGFKPVWFNAWHHQKEEHLLASLLQNIRLQAIPSWWRLEGIIFRARLLRIRGGRRLLPFLLVLLFIAALTGYVINPPVSLWEYLSTLELARLLPEKNGWLELTAKLVGPLTLIGTIVTSLRKGLTAFGVKPAALMSSGASKLSVGDLEAQTSFRQKFAVEFQDVTKALNPRTMIIFIDDLDRCRPENVLEVLEAVNFLLSSGDCFVIMGMARERVERCVGLGFKDVAEEMVDDQPDATAGIIDANKGRSKRSEFAKQYLDKLINIEVPVPAATASALGELLVPVLKNEDTSYKWVAPLAVFAKKAWPVLFIGSLLCMGFWAGRNLPHPTLPSPVGNNNAQVNSNAQANSNTSTQGPIASVNANRPGNRNSSSPPARDPLPSIQPLAEFADSQPSSQLPEYGLVGFIFLFVISVGVWILTRPLNSIVKDSPPFRKALEIWHPVVTAKRKTPRSMKRFTNRVRYLAMRQRPPKESSRLWQRLRRKGEPTPAQKTPALVPEPALVMLCVVDDFNPRLVRDERSWSELSLWSNSVIDPSGIASQEELRTALVKHKTDFPSGWPTPKHRETYLEITAGLRVN